MTDSPRLALLTALRLSTNGAFRFLYPFLPVVAADVGLTTTSSGLLLSALALGGVLAPVGRRLLTGVDERNRALISRAGIALTLGALIAAAAPTPLVAVAGLMLLGAGKPLTDVGAVSYVSARVPFAQRARATSTMELTWSGGLLIVAPIAGVVAAATSWRVPLAGIALVVLALVLVASRQLSDVSTAPTSDGPHQPFGATARRFLVVIFFVFAGLEVSFAAFGVWLEDAFGASVQQLGGFAALTATGELLGAAAVLAFADRVGKARAAGIGLAVTALGAGGLVLADSAGQAAVALAACLFGTEIAIVAAIPLATEVVPHARSAYLARVVATGSVARVVMGGAAPALYSWGGIGVNASITAGVALGGMAVLRWTVRHDPRLAA